MGSLSTKILTSGSGERIIIESSSFRTTHTKRPANINIKYNELMRDVYIELFFSSILHLSIPYFL
uniref:Uncharacterized protein n=1 Tax=Lotus japonicus TaxID=34305 RepID=I3SAH5_LOTJA|nr:unknown [Lotus japonicus]